MPIINKTKRTAAIYNRGREVVKVYDHGTLAWQKQSSIPDYLCFTALEAGTFTLTIKASVGVGNLRYMEWSKDGKTWNHVDNEASVEKSIPVDVAVGDKVYWRGQGVNMTASSAAVANCSQFSSTARFDVSGHIMSLLKGDDFLNYQHLTNYDTDGVRNVTFTYLFYGCTTLVNAKDLILPTFTSYYTYIFQWMFRGCTALVSAPALPSLASAQYCYYGMFYSCSSLTQAPPTIAATQLETQSCRSTFQGCTSLVTAPSIAATILNGTGELYQTFQGCTALVTPPPHLYPSILNPVSYYQTFQGCNHMTTMPTLHFTSLASNANHACYQMFSGCSLMEGEVAIDVPHAPHHAFAGMLSSCKITKAYVRCPSADQAAFAQTFFNMATLEDIDIVGASTLGGVQVYLSCFYGCRATRQSIVLPATIPTDECYKYMFYGNGGTISHITCLATDISATDCTLDWLVGASSTGTFIQAEGVTWPRGASGIPTGWLAYDEGEEIPNDYEQLDYAGNDSGRAWVNVGAVTHVLEAYQITFRTPVIGTQVICGYFGLDTEADPVQASQNYLYARASPDSFQHQHYRVSGDSYSSQNGLLQNIRDTEWHTFKMWNDNGSRHMEFDGVDKGISTREYATKKENLDMYLFHYQGTNGYANVHISEFIRYEEDAETETMHLLPCKRKSDDVVGYWDTIGLLFLTSGNAHALIGGYLTNNENNE